MILEQCKGMHCVDLGEYLVAKFRFDTAENEPCKVCHADLDCEVRRRGALRRADIRRRTGAECACASTQTSRASRRKPSGAEIETIPTYESRFPAHSCQFFKIYLSVLCQSIIFFHYFLQNKSK